MCGTAFKDVMKNDLGVIVQRLVASLHHALGGLHGFGKGMGMGLLADPAERRQV